MLVVARGCCLDIWRYTLIMQIMLLGLRHRCLISNYMMLVRMCEVIMLLLPVLRLRVYLICTVIALGRLLLMLVRSMRCILSLVLVALLLGLGLELILLEFFDLVEIFYVIHLCLQEFVEILHANSLIIQSQFRILHAIDLIILRQVLKVFLHRII